MSRSTLLGLATASLALAFTPLSAQQPERIPEGSLALSQYSLEHWDDRNGLPQNSVQAIAQTKDGYLWLGTQIGLARFDGMRFEVFDGADSPALKRPFIWALEPDEDGGLWIGSEEGGLVHASDGNFTAYTKADGLPHTWVNALELDRSGNLWIGTAGGLAVRRPGGTFELIDSARGLSPKFITDIVQDTSGVIWVGYAGGLARIRDGRVEQIALGSKPTTTHALVAKPGGGVYAATVMQGVFDIQNDVITKVVSPAQLPAVVRTLALDEDGALWAGTARGIVQIDNGVASVFPEGQGTTHGVVSLSTDNEGSLWLGLDGGGLARMRRTPIIPFGKPEGLAGDMIYPIMQARNGDVWIGTGGDGVNVVRDGKVIHHYTQQNQMLPNNFVTTFAEDPEGRMWIGTLAGISRIVNGKAEIFPPGAGGLPATLISAITIDTRGAVWVGSHHGLHRFRPGPAELFTVEHGLADNFIVSVVEARDGAIWAATREGLSRLANGRFKTYTAKDGLPAGGITALYQDEGGTLWIGGEAALARFENGRIDTFDASNGMCATQIMSIVEDDHGRLWLGSLKGIFALERRTLGNRTAACKVYERAAGMRSREVNGLINPPAWKMSDGRIWFGSIRGIAIVNPADLDLDLAPPPVQIEGVVAQGRTYSSLPDRLPAGVRMLEIRFTGLSFVAPDQMRFRYKLEGFDDEWIDAGSRRSAFYTHLHPGKFTFRVQAANADGQWNEAGAFATFLIAPRWFETWEFKTAVVAVLVLTLWLIYRLRVRGMQARQRELVGLAQESARAEARYRELFENATDAVFTTDTEGNFTGVNRKAELLTGYTRDEALKLNVRDVLPRSEQGERVVRQWLSGTADSTERVDIISKSGERVPAEVGTRIVEEGGVAIGIQAIARDVTERAALERQLRQSQKMDAVGQLAGGVAHDFNNLLTVIRGNGELLLGDLPEGSAAREDVEQINLAADRASALTRQLLAFSRKQVVNPRPLDLNVVLRDLEKMLQRLIGEDLTILTLPTVEPARVIADPTQIEQVLMNLVVNARDAMPKGGAITIETRIMNVEDVPQSPVRSASGRAVMLIVSDNGIGMDAETQARVFEPFFTTKDPGKGTGLGLSTVYGIVQQAGGHIMCSSRSGSGTTFRIYLPYASEGLLEKPLDERFTLNAGNETILLVEDEDAVRTLTSRVLRHNGYEVIEARHGQDALSASHDYPGPIDLLLSDVVLPAMNGRVLSEKLMQYRPDLRVLLMSGYTDDEILRRGLLEPGTVYLQKPFTPQGLLRMVRDVLDSEMGAAAD